jgi:transcriptional regulator with XRE-family HTH domain
MDDVYQDELRLRLTEAMDLHGFSQNEVAKRAGVNQGIISRFVRGGGMSEENSGKINDFLVDLDEAPVPSTDETRRAIRLYRFMQNLTDNGTTIILRHADGTEQALLILM